MTPTTAAAAATSEVVARVLADRAHLAGPLLPVLHGVQDALGWVPADAVPPIAEALDLSRAEVHGVLSYYHHFRQQPVQGPVLQVCRAEACRSMGGEELLAHARNTHRCTVEPAYCLGLCAQSPAVLLDGHAHARMTPTRIDALVDAASRGAAR